MLDAGFIQINFELSIAEWIAERKALIKTATRRAGIPPAGHWSFLL